MNQIADIHPTSSIAFYVAGKVKGERKGRRTLLNYSACHSTGPRWSVLLIIRRRLTFFRWENRVKLRTIKKEKCKGPTINFVNGNLSSSIEERMQIFSELKNKKNSLWNLHKKCQWNLRNNGMIFFASFINFTGRNDNDEWIDEIGKSFATK